MEGLIEILRGEGNLLMRVSSVKGARTAALWLSKQLDYTICVYPYENNAAGLRDSIYHKGTEQIL